MSDRDGPNLDIRTATVADLPLIVGMSDAIQAVEREIVGYPMLEPARTSAAYLDRLMERHAAGGLTMIATLDGRPAGYISGHHEHDDDIFVDLPFRSFARISDLYVAEPARRQGLATALVEAFATEMRRRGEKYLRIATKANNAVALDSYLRLGFEQYEVELFRSI